MEDSLVKKHFFDSHRSKGSFDVLIFFDKKAGSRRNLGLYRGDVKCQEKKGITTVF